MDWRDLFPFASFGGDAEERRVGADEGCAHAAAKSPLIGSALAGEARASALLLQAS
jgi:hypothetical protein